MNERCSEAPGKVLADVGTVSIIVFVPHTQSEREAVGWSHRPAPVASAVFNE